MLRRLYFFIGFALLAACCISFASFYGGVVPEVVGRWNLTVGAPPNTYPSWLEVTVKDSQLAGRFVGKAGSARPIRQIEFANGTLSFSLPPQYERTKASIIFQGTLAGDQLKGTTQGEDGLLHWVGVRAPELPRNPNPKWGKPITLFNGKDMRGWQLKKIGSANGWKAANGVMENHMPSSDIVTEQPFMDFKLHLEFNVAPKSNSGIYLRGRYEVQIQDDYGKPPESHFIGGLYGFIDPTVNAAKKALEWQSYDITLLGRWITVVLNGRTVIDNKEIPGSTGGALNSREEEPGPLMLQGDHGDISFRNVIVTPAER